MADEPGPGGDQVEFAQNVTGDENGRPALFAEPVQLIPVVASGRLAREKDHLTLIRALALCRNRRRIRLTIAGTGPMERRLKVEAARQLDSMPVSRLDSIRTRLRQGRLPLDASVRAFAHMAVQAVSGQEPDQV